MTGESQVEKINRTRRPHIKVEEAEEEEEEEDDWRKLCENRVKRRFELKPGDRQQLLVARRDICDICTNLRRQKTDLGARYGFRPPRSIAFIYLDDDAGCLLVYLFTRLP